MVINEKARFIHCLSAIWQWHKNRRWKEGWLSVHLFSCLCIQAVCLVEKSDVLRLINVTDTVEDRVTSDIFFLVCGRGSSWWQPSCSCFLRSLLFAVSLCRFMGLQSSQVTILRILHILNLLRINLSISKVWIQINPNILPFVFAARPGRQRYLHPTNLGALRKHSHDNLAWDCLRL